MKVKRSNSLWILVYENMNLVVSWDFYIELLNHTRNQGEHYEEQNFKLEVNR